MQWNLHLVGEALETELEDALQRLITDLEGIGHRLTSATLTTDTGQRPLATTPVEESETQTVGGEPVVPPAPVPPVDDTVTSDSSLPASSPEVPTDTPPVLGATV
jgi:hypothetical protein